MRQFVTTNKVYSMSLGAPGHAWRTSTTNATPFKKGLQRRSHFSTRGKAVQCQFKKNKIKKKKRRRPPHCAPRTALFPMSAARTQVSLLPSPSACLLHYLKLSLVFICRAGDVASSSTFPSRAVYIREPIWLYKTRQQKGGGPEPERGETVEAILQSGELRARRPRAVYNLWRNVKDIFGVISYECSALTK